MDRNKWLVKINEFLPKNPKGVEIGVFKGEFSKKILQTTSLTLYMVDVWRELSDDEYLDSSNHRIHTTAYQESMENVVGFEDRGIMLRANSQVASEMFQDESLDFVYIDANHAYDYVVEDIKLWYPKLRRGGILSGHDYINMDWYNDPNFLPNKKDKHIWSNETFYHGVFGVNPAVDEFCNKHSYKLNKTDEWFGTWWIVK
jgi:hypothetical protein